MIANFLKKKKQNSKFSFSIPRIPLLKKKLFYLNGKNYMARPLSGFQETREV